MSDHPHPDQVVVRNVAIATDFSPWSERATQHAIVVAHRFGAVLHFLHTVRRSEFAIVPDMMVQLDQLAQRDCGDMIGRLKASKSLDNVEHYCWTVDGEFAEVFESFIHEHAIDLLVLGTRGRSGLSKLLLGSLAQEIFHYVDCPVLTVGPWSRGAARKLELRKVLFATDLTDESAAAIPYVLTAARTWHTEIDVLHVCSSAACNCRKQMESFSRKIDELARKDVPVLITYTLLHGDPSSTVLNFASQNNDDLIVLGLARSRSLYGGPVLSHAYEIVRGARCPVLSTRPGALAVLSIPEAQSPKSQDAAGR